MSIQIQTSQNVNVEYDLASVGERIAAQLIDYVVYFGWALLWTLLASLMVGGSASTFFIIFAVALPVLFYPLICEYFWEGQTLGKRALDIKVVRLDGNQPTLGAYVIRWTLIIIDNIMSGLVAILTIAIGGKGQRLGDVAAGTAVIKTRKPVTLEQVTYNNLPQNYRVTYAEASQLSDVDVDTIRKVLLKKNEELMAITADKINLMLEIGGYTDARTFLITLINDYAYLAVKDDENV